MASSSRTSTELPADWMEKYNLFNKYRDEGYSHIDKGIKSEEQSRNQEAIASYEAGLKVIDKALQIYLENVPHQFWDKYYENVMKMKNTRKEILSRLTDLQNPDVMNGGGYVPAVPNAPPSYEEATSLSSNSSPYSTLSSAVHDAHNSLNGNVSCPYTALNHTLHELKVETGATSGNVLYVQENVRMYFISPDGRVGSMSDPSTLTIAQIQDDHAAEINPRFYLQIGDWIYPLLPGLSPVLHSEFGAFIIPDVHSPVEGSAVGLILPDGSDSSVYEILDDILQGIHKQVSAEKGAPPPRPPPPYISVVPMAPQAPQPISKRISQGLITGAQYLSYGLVKGAEKAGEFLNTNTPKVLAKIQPEPEPQPVNPTVKKSMKIAKNVTGTAVQVTGYVANKVGAATLALGRYLAPHVQTHGTKLITSVSGLSEAEAAGKVEGALEVTSGAVQGFSTVYGALENSAKILATSLANNTVQIVEHKYGPSAAEVTGDTLYTVGNAVVATHNAQGLTVKGIAKRTAKDTGKAVIQDYSKNKYMKEKDGEEGKDNDGAGPSGVQ